MRGRAAAFIPGQRGCQGGLELFPLKNEAGPARAALCNPVADDMLIRHSAESPAADFAIEPD